mgnify:CR=1 FL=1
MTKIYQHKCLQCGKIFHNRYPESKFCTIWCSVDYHTSDENKNHSLCALCHCVKEVDTDKYCYDCQKIVDNFKKMKPICYICHSVIKGWNLKYYQAHGRMCMDCIIKRNEENNT